MKSEFSDDVLKKYFDNSKQRKLVFKSSGDYVAEKIDEFLKVGSDSFSWLSFEKVKSDVHSSIEYGNYKFIGVPLGGEVEPFIKLISEIDINSSGTSDFTIKLFAAAMCPHCPIVFLKLINIFKEFNLFAKIYFTDDYPEFASQSNVLSVPCVIIEKNGKEIERFTGNFNENDLVNLIKDTDISSMSSDFFINILEQGKAENLAETISKAGVIPDGFKSLFTYDKWSTRLGAIVCGEFLNELNVDLYDELIDDLIFEYDSCPVPVKGDILYLTGLSKKIDARVRFLKEVLSKESDESVIDAANESLETLNGTD